MKAAELDRKHKCPGCSSNIFIVENNPLYANGPKVAFVKCVNAECGKIIGQLEPNSVTSNLSGIHTIMSRIEPVLKDIEALLQSQPLKKVSQHPQDNAKKEPTPAPQAKIVNPSQQPLQNPTGQTPPAGANPEYPTTPLSSPPEADQSLG